MLVSCNRFEIPYAHFTSGQALDAADLEQTRGLFASPLPWETRTGSFYVTHRLDITDYPSTTAPYRMAAERIRADMHQRVKEIFAAELDDRVQVLAHRMSPGQEIGIHNDNPRLGYECWRVLVYISSPYSPDSGGRIRVHGPDKGIIKTIEPAPNTAFGFEMSRMSFHSVEPVKGSYRDALIYNFWHIGNTKEIEKEINTVLNETELCEPLKRTKAVVTHWLKQKAQPAEHILCAQAMDQSLDAAKFAQHCGSDLMTVIGVFLYCLKKSMKGLPTDLAVSLYPKLHEFICGFNREWIDGRLMNGLGMADDPDQSNALQPAMFLLSDWVSRLPRHPFAIPDWNARKREIMPIRNQLPNQARSKFSRYFHVFQ